MDAGGNTASEQSSPGRPTRVLVVEDDDAIRRLIASLLERERMEVIEETRSDRAIAVLEEAQFAAIILDLMILPGGGRSVLDWMERKRPDLLPRTVIVSAASPTQIERVTKGRPCRSVPKPFDIAELIEMVMTCAR